MLTTNYRRRGRSHEQKFGSTRNWVASSSHGQEDPTYHGVAVSDQACFNIQTQYILEAA